MAFNETIARRGLDTRWEDLILAMAGGDVGRASLIKGVIARESEWKPNAINPADPSYGLMQILAGAGGPYPNVAPQDLLDPATNITLGSRFLMDLLRRYPEADAVSAYNAGRPISGNRGYVDDILRYQVWYLNHLSAEEAPGDVLWETPALDEPLAGTETATLAVGLLLLVGVLATVRSS